MTDTAILSIVCKVRPRLRLTSVKVVRLSCCLLAPHNNDGGLEHLFGLCSDGFNFGNHCGHIYGLSHANCTVGHCHIRNFIQDSLHRRDNLNRGRGQEVDLGRYFDGSEFWGKGGQE